MTTDINKMIEQMKKYNQMDKDLQEKELNTKEELRRKNAEKSNQSDWRRIHTETVEKIEGFGFEILSFDDNAEDNTDYYAPIGIFQCQYKNWLFSVTERPDPDIPNMLQVYEIKNNETAEEIRFYVDLNCHNTGPDKLDKFLRLLELGQEQFILEQYGKYIELPLSFEQEGFKVDLNDFTFNLESSNGYFVLNDKIKVSVVYHWKDSLTLSSVRGSKYRSYEKPDIVFSFDYSSKEQFGELLQFVTLLEEQIDGKYGFLEVKDEVETFYKNEDLEKLFKTSRYDNELALDKNEFIEISDITDAWQYSEDDNGFDKKISHPNGVEIYKAFNFRLNDRMGYLEECIMQEFNITFTYNKNIDENNCILSIEHSVVYNKESVEKPTTMWDYDNEVLEENSSEFKGTFTECVQTLIKFLDQLVVGNELEFSEEYIQNKQKF